MNALLNELRRLAAGLWGDLEGQLFTRLEPLVSNLRPVWSDPLWQFVALVAAAVLALVLLVLLLRGLSGLLGRMLEGSLAVLGKPFGWMRQGAAALGRRLRQREAKVRADSAWFTSKPLRAGLDVIRYLSTRRDWRYRTPWYLLSGADDAWRHPWIEAQQDGRRVQLLARERQLVADGSLWHFFDQGVVIAPATSGDYAGTLNLLNCYRPERPVDGLLLTVSAESLLDAGEATQRKQLGEQLFRQMWSLQKVTGFVVPVYLLVTGCEQVPGFEAFWASQPELRRQEMFGWANPARLDTAFQSGWVAEAFRQLAEGIHRAQLQVAAGGQDIVDVDSFMLFDREFQALQEPLQQVVEHAFARSSFQEALPLRGIWFTGEVAGEQALSGDFFKHRLWPEVNLARPVEQRNFSTNRTLRRVQYGTLAAAALLLLLLVVDTTRLHAYSSRLEADWDAVAATELDCAKPAVEDPGATLWWMLDKLTVMGQQPLTPSIPASWFGGQMDELVQDTADTFYAGRIFVDMECRLLGKASALLAQPAGAAPAEADPVAAQRQAMDAAGDFMTALLAYQDAYARFVHLAGPLTRSERVADDFQALLDYLYDSRIPPSIDFDGPLLEQAVMHAAYDLETALLPDQYVLIEQLERHVQAARSAIARAALEPPLDALREAFSADAGQSRDLRGAAEHAAGIRGAIEGFDGWLRNVNTEWLATDAFSSPCGRLALQGTALAERLGAAGYPARDLDLALAALGAEQCDGSIRSQLQQLDGELFGRLVVEAGTGRLQFSPGVQAWQQEMQALTGLSVVARSFEFSEAELARATSVTGIDSVDARSSEGKVVGWQLAPLQDAIDLVLSWQSFRQRWWMTEQGIVEPFYATALQQRLRLLVQALIQRALVRESAAAPSPLVHDRDMEAQLAERVAGFQKGNAAIRQLIQLLAQEGDSGNSVNLNGHARDFVRSQLDALWTLVEQDRLYQGRSAPDWSRPNFAAALFGYGEPADIASYLDHQRLRTAYLTQQYARPLIAYLLDSGGVAQTDVNAQRWVDTLTDLRRYERKEPASEVLQLEEYVGSRLQGLSEASCSTVLQAPAVTAASHALFATRQQQLDQLVRNHCLAQGKHGVVQQYQALAERFNSELANRFPFAAVDDTRLPEVRPEVVNRFFRDYQANWAAAEGRPGLLQALRDLARAQPALVPRAWLDFVASLDRLALFWNQVLAADDTLQVQLAVQFAALPELSQGVRQIIAWDLSSGNARLAFPNGGSSTVWRPGDRLMLGLRWASGSAYRPARSLQTPVQIDEAQRRALFVSQRQWSLFEWLQRHGDADNSPAQGNLLAFHVPVTEVAGVAAGSAVAAEAAAPVAPLAYITRANLLLGYVVTGADGSQQQYRLPAELPRVAPGLQDPQAD